MEKEITFRSQTNKKIGYCWKSGASDTPMSFYSNPSSFINSYATRFDRYDDYPTKHSAEYPVSATNMIDFLGSLAINLFHNQDEIPIISSSWRDMTDSNEKILFFSNLKYSDEKIVYFSENELKISRSENKQYDRRWEKVPKWADGSINSVVKFMTKSYYGALDIIMLHKQVRKILDIFDSSYSEYLQTIGIDFNQIIILNQAIDSINYFVESYRNKKNAESSIECLKTNWKRGE